MKKLLLTLLFASASMHAMDKNVRIVPFDSNTQGQAVRDIYCKTLPGFIVPGPLWHSPDPTKHDKKVDILIRYANATDAQNNHDGTLIGLAFYTITSSVYRNCYGNALRSDQFKAYTAEKKESAALIRSLENKEFTYMGLHAICIDTPDQNKGYGKFLLQHTEEYGKKHCDMIYVSCLKGQETWYQKLGYLCDDLRDHCSLAKPFSLHASIIIKAIDALVKKSETTNAMTNEVNTESGERPAKKNKKHHTQSQNSN